MLLGLGVDLCSIDRIEMALQKHGARFIERILNPYEREMMGAAAHEPRKLAKAYALKEAAAKAVGTGIGEIVSFQDITTGREASGRPFVRLEGRGLAHIMAGLGAGYSPRFHASLSDEAGLVYATVIIEAIDKSTYSL